MPRFSNGRSSPSIVPSNALRMFSVFSGLSFKFLSKFSVFVDTRTCYENYRFLKKGICMHICIYIYLFVECAVMAINKSPTMQIRFIHITSIRHIIYVISGIGPSSSEKIKRLKNNDVNLYLRFKNYVTFPYVDINSRHCFSVVDLI